MQSCTFTAFCMRCSYISSLMKPCVTIGGTWYFLSCIAPLCPNCMPVCMWSSVWFGKLCMQSCLEWVWGRLWSLKMCPVCPHQPESVLRRTLVPVSGEKPSVNQHFCIRVIMQSAWGLLYLGGHSVRLCKQPESCLCPCDQSVSVCSVLVYAIIHSVWVRYLWKRNTLLLLAAHRSILSLAKWRSCGCGSDVADIVLE